MRILYFGTPDFAVPTLKALLASPETTVAAVVTQPDKRRGRGGRVSPSPVKAVALEAGIPVWQPSRLRKDKALWETLAGYRADAFVVVAYGQLLPPPVLALPPLGCINGHGSLLPYYRGAAPIQWSLYHGEPETGVTTMLMDAGMDTGPMLLKQSYPLAWDATAEGVAADLAKITAELILATLAGLKAGTLSPQPQPAGATYAPLLTKADFELDWGRSAWALHNQVRGFYPQGVTRFRGQELKVLGTVPLGAGGPLPPPWAAYGDWQPPGGAVEPGTIAAVLKGIGPVVQTGQGYLLLRQVQPKGKRLQSGLDFANGQRLLVGESLAG